MEERILVLDDEIEIANLVALYLRNEGYTVEEAHTAEEAYASIQKAPPDLAILDVMLPDGDGFTLCRNIRQTYTFPVIMLTARVEDIDKITGLTIGADDYITKPFNPMELTARVKAQLRRYKRYNETVSPSVFEQRGLYINNETHECTLFDRELSLHRWSSKFFGCSAKIAGAWFPQRNCLKRSGEKNISTAATL